MPDLTRRDFLKGAAASLAAGPILLAGCRRRKTTLNVLNWAGYMAQASLARFEQDTGIVINHDAYFSEDDMLAKLSAKADLDLVVAPGYLIPQLKAAQLIAPIPHERLTQLVNIAKRFREPEYDPGLRYSVPYLWGTTGLGFNTTHVHERPDSWRALWNERYHGRITMLDDAREAIGCALLLLGLPLDAHDPAHLAKAGELLRRQRPLVKEYTSSTYADELASGEVWLAQGWNGDVLQSALEKNMVDFVIPREGSFLWMDNLCLTKEGGSSEESLRFLDFMLKPSVAAEICAAVRYATPNEKALPLLDAALRSDPRIFPPDEIAARLHQFPLLNAVTTEQWRKTWRDVKRA